MQSIHDVGCFLEAQARSRQDPERDAFARSTFNRFYYATFLEVRNFLKSVGHESWEKIGHKSYPDVLRAIAADLKKAATRARRSGDEETNRLLSKAITALQRISDIMQLSYTSRVVADYNLEMPVEFGEGGKFHLNKVSVNTAKSWRNDVYALIPVVKSAYLQALER